MKLNIKKLLDFLDGNNDFHKGDVAAIIGLIEEDLNASVYEHFRNNEVEVLNNSVIQGGRGGKWLDRWILDKKNNTLLQCEIKNWSATAIGGRKLKAESTDEERVDVVQYYWNRELKATLSKDSKHLHPNLVTKVLLQMKKPKEHENILKIKPLIIYWMPISSDKKGLKPVSVISTKSLKLPIKSDFVKLNIFSVSLYLRQLYKNGKGNKFINLDMENVKRRASKLVELGIK